MCILVVCIYSACVACLQNYTNEISFIATCKWEKVLINSGGRNNISSQCVSLPWPLPMPHAPGFKCEAMWNVSVKSISIAISAMIFNYAPARFKYIFDINKSKSKQKNSCKNLACTCEETFLNNVKNAGHQGKECHAKLQIS